MCSTILLYGAILCATVSSVQGVASVSFAATPTSYVGQEGRHVSIRLRKTGSSANIVHVVVKVLEADMTANGGKDFLGDSQVAQFSAGSSDENREVSFFVKDDSIPEDAETFRLQVDITGGDAITGSPGEVTVTIPANDNAFGVFSFMKPSPLEVKEGDTVTLTIDREFGKFGNVTLSYQIIGATPLQDISPSAGGQVVFLAGDARKTISLSILNDQVPENDESYTVSLSVTSGSGSVNVSDIDIMIIKNDAPLRFVQDAYQVEEGASDSQVTISVSRGLEVGGQGVIGPIDKEVVVNYRVTPGTAVKDQDYSIQGSNTIRFRPSETVQNFTITIKADNIPEIGETFTIELYDPSGDAVLANPFRVVVTILANDDENGVLSLKSPSALSLPTVQVNEDTTTQTSYFHVVRSSGTFGDVSVQWRLVRNDSNTDIVTNDVAPASGIATLANGQNETVITLTVIQDSVPEPAELFKLMLLPNTVTGGAKVEGILEGLLILEDSDNAYGQVVLSQDSNHKLITSTDPRHLEISIERLQGTFEDITVTFTVDYETTANNLTAADILNITNPASIVLPAGLSKMTTNVDIFNGAFLSVGAQFTVTLKLVSPKQAVPYGHYNSPVLGAKTTTSVTVTADAANGEIGFESTQTVVVDEPDGTPKQVTLTLTREGTNGQAIVSWELKGSGPNAASVTATDTATSSGTVLMNSGASSGSVVITILPDDTPETDEEMTITLIRADPPDEQKLRAGSTQVKIVIRENDNPGGTFQFSSAMSPTYVVEEEGQAVEMSVVRSGGSLVSRQVEYFIEPNGEAEFYGSRGVLEFLPGETVKKKTVMAQDDNVPELTESFTLMIRSYGQSSAVIGPLNKINITVLPSNDPYGVLTFDSSQLITTIGETKNQSQKVTAVLRLFRQRGTFGTVTVNWVVTPSTSRDVTPLSGTVIFGNGDREKNIEVHSTPDQLPENAETFYVNLTTVTGGARLGQYTVATVVVKKNDDAIYFKAPAMVKVSESNDATLTVVRNGDASAEARVYYSTIDGSATAQDRDYMAVSDGLIQFAVGETERNISITTMQDNVPETDEIFMVQLFNAEGDVVVHGAISATVVIMANDDANGVFSFGRTQVQSTDEGVPTNFEVIRERGRFGVVNVYWELLDNRTMTRVTENKDFAHSTGFITFQDGVATMDIVVMAAKDSEPEYAETFVLRLFNISGGGPSGQEGQLASTHLTSTLVVKENDDPYGVFAFPASSRQKSVAEDYYPGAESSTVANFTIERMMGLFGEVEVLWEVFSDAIAGTLPSMMDLLFLADVPSGSIVSGGGRQGTNTRVVAFGAPVIVPAVYQTPKSDIESGFSLSARVSIPHSTNGFVVAKTNEQGSVVYYGLKVVTQNGTTQLEFHYATNGGSQVTQNTATFTVNQDISGGRWYHLLVTVDGGFITLYLDGKQQTRQNVAAQQSSVTDGNGPLMVGAKGVGNGQFTGRMQDVRVFSRKLDEKEITELFSAPSIMDVTPVSGYLTYAPGAQYGNVVIRSKQDTEVEGNEVFSVKLISAKGGARVSDNDASGKLTVLKSDNANGLFGFKGQCTPSLATDESSLIRCPVGRDRGDDGTVTVDWIIHQETNGTSSPAMEDFSNYSGQLVFKNGDEEQTISFRVKNDDLPELIEKFTVRLVSAMSDDGLVGSTNTSGASIDPLKQANTISIEQNDYPYGLLQFSDKTTPPGVGDPMILPATSVPEVRVAEESGTARLLVVRAQGVTGRVSIEWRTVDDVAKSAGKTPPDFINDGGTLEFSENERYKFISVTIKDNSIPEDDKSFFVELHNPTGGAEIAVAQKIRVIIENSDDAYGVFSFADNSLTVSGSEKGDTLYNTVDLTVERTGGLIGSVTVYWHVVDDRGNDLVDDNGNVTFTNGQTTATIELKVAGDTIPELDETFTITITNVSKGRLASSKLSSSLRIDANDDPYGMFYIPSKFRPFKTPEGSLDVVVEVKRDFGSFGTVRVNYTTLTRNQYFAYLPGNVERANATDFVSTHGSLIFSSGERTKTFNVTIIDDDIAETDETVFAILTGLDLIQGSQIRGVEKSPRLSSPKYAQIIIESNDNANGILSLSASSVSVAENFTGSFIFVVRSGGDFGEVTVKFEVLPGSAQNPLDYSYTSTDVVLSDGERKKAVPVRIVNDLLPEGEETFTVRLVNQVTGGAVLGTTTSCAVIILPSDDPNGLFEFSGTSLTIDEPETPGGSIVNITVDRKGGLDDVVAVKWHATLDGKSAENDITPVDGTIYFLSDEARQNIIVTVRPDDIAEGQEEIKITLMSATKRGRIGPNNVFSLYITPNDNPHGVVRFLQPLYTLTENREQSIQYVMLTRMGGTVGALRVTFSTGDLDKISEATSGGKTVFDYFNDPVRGSRASNITVDLTGQVNPAQYCAEMCLKSEAWKSYEYNSRTLSCKMFTSADASNLDTTNLNALYYIKDEIKARRLYESLAKSNIDYIRSTDATIIMADGASTGEIPINVLADNIPELNEKFTLSLSKVELLSGPPTNPANNPKLGTPSQATVVIAANDDANGMFRILSPMVAGSVIAVNEQQSVVELTVEREGGNIGDVSVTWSVNTRLSSATKDVDFTADGATLNFASGENRKAITIGIKDDQLAEVDEDIVVVLSDPQGGALLSAESNITIIVKANDNVAGLIGFAQSSIVTEEGASVNLTVTRTKSYVGTVTVQWTIEHISGHSPQQGFLQYTGFLTFLPGDRSKVIPLQLLTDDTPELNEEYRIKLHNLSTVGVRESGAAAVNPQSYLATITIKGSNEPHGVFSFAASSLNLRTEENNATVRLTIDRKFGAIGSVRVFYNIMEGSLTPLNKDLVKATANGDFVSGLGSVDLSNGVSSATIDVTINDDNIPEIDEVFIVNLTAVSLLSQSFSNFQPKLGSADTTSEIIINANDGTKGQLKFIGAQLSVNESNANYTLTVLRERGTFGEVSVYFYGQGMGALIRKDFMVKPGTLYFAAGESRKEITVQIFDDSEAEPEESFEVVLASPSGGVEIGQPDRAVVTILNSDGASGYVTFDSADEVTLTEPSSSSTANSIAELRLTRGPGFFGQVTVPFEVVPVGNSGQPITDITPSSDYVVFNDKQPSATLKLTVTQDNIPELDEVFMVRLKEPQGGAKLGAVTERKLIISANDSPYGLFNIYVKDTLNNEISVEEDSGLVHVDVVRTQGMLGKVTLQLQTVGGTATATSGSNLVLSPLAMVQVSQAVGWHSYEFSGMTYMLLLSGYRKGALKTAVGSNGADVPVNGTGEVMTSVLYRWQGALVPIQSLETDGAVRATSFTEGGKTYLVVINQGQQGAYETSSRVYVIKQDGSLTVLQNLPTRGASDVHTYKVGSTRFMVITNYADNRGSTSISSDVFRWDTINGRFLSINQPISTLGASAVTAFVIGGDTYLAIANKFASGSYEVDSIVYKIEQGAFVLKQRIPSKGAVDIKSFSVDGTTYLVLANSRDNAGRTSQNSTVFKWDSTSLQFVTVQHIQTENIHRVNAFTASNGLVHLAFANRDGGSVIYSWDITSRLFTQRWTGPVVNNMSPMRVTQSTGDMVLVGSASSANTSNVYLTSLLGASDFVPRTTTLTFEPGQSHMSLAVEVLPDDFPEDTETFTIVLSKPTGGADVGIHSSISVNILSNDDAHGVIEFSEESANKMVSELVGKDNRITLNVDRKAGLSGRVVVRWSASGQNDGVNDITPIFGTVEFADGAKVAQIVLTIKDDQLPELDELTLVKLTTVQNGGTSLAGRGAKIGQRDTARLTVLANDSPHGVVSWERTTVTTTEPEGSDTTVMLHLVREQGTQGKIEITYVTARDTSLPTNQQAVSGQDYVSTQAVVTMDNGVQKASVEIGIKADNEPEAAETFLVDVTAVKLVGGTTQPGAAPSIKQTARKCAVTITENDNARGVIEFNVTRDADQTVKTYESVGKNTLLKLTVLRSIGFFGAVTVTWQTSPRTADNFDFAPPGGDLKFSEGQKTADIEIYIIDDQIAEPIETFDVQLVKVTGGAILGADAQVRVSIIKNDSPNGMFEFDVTQKSVREAKSETDPLGTVNFDVVRTQGSNGLVVVEWRLEAAAQNDFLEPHSGRLTFGAGETRKSIQLKTKPDAILEGEERFAISLVSATNNGDISPTNGDATIVILPDDGASGIVAILPEYRSILIGEPSAVYRGRARIDLTRGVGIFGRVRVEWGITPRDLTAFTAVNGAVFFEDGQQVTSIEIQAKDDSVPEIKRLFTLEILSVEDGAKTSSAPGATMASILFVASDYPHGSFEFQSPAQVNVSEDSVQVSLTIMRNWGSIGQVRVGYTTSPGTATAGQDFDAATGSLTFSNGQTQQMVVIRLKGDNLPEGPEAFYVNLTNVELQSPADNNYTVVNGLQQDMAPVLGQLSVKTIIIDKNDNAEGTLTFDIAAVNFQVAEDIGIARIPVIRQGGSFGPVGVRYTSRNLTAEKGVDYILNDGVVQFGNGMVYNTINVTIRDDPDQEMGEQLEVKLTEALGGASLGDHKISVVTILKSDYPNGKFGFTQQTEMIIPNPVSNRELQFTIARTEGFKKKQILKWQIMGPDNVQRKLEETNDIAYIVNGRELTQGQMTWEDQEGGAKSFKLTVKPYTDWEVQKIFFIQIYDIQSEPSGPENGEVSPTSHTVKLTVLKHGDPNGIVRFDGLAQVPREVEEPSASQGAVQIKLPIFRSEGTIGTQMVHWEVRGPAGTVPDIDPMLGIAQIPDETRRGEISLRVLPDDVAELSETFQVVLKLIEGGAEIDKTKNTSTLVIKYNDDPHGVFSLDPKYQSVIVNTIDLSRKVLINITRNAGTFGRVRVSFGIVYDQPVDEFSSSPLMHGESGISYVPSSSAVMFENGDKFKLVDVNIQSNVFLTKGTTFTVELTSVQYIGDATIPPKIAAQYKNVKVAVPQEAANSEVGFQTTVINVDDATNKASVVIERIGSYGKISIDWQAGYPVGTLPQGFTRGIVLPSSGRVQFSHGESTKAFEVELTSQANAAELFAVHLPRDPSSEDGGGAKLRTGYTIGEIEPMGVIQFAANSRTVSVTEDDLEVTLVVQRLFGTLKSVKIRYSTSSGSATGDVDYEQIPESAVTIAEKKTTAQIRLRIKKDNIPENDEDFFVNLKAVFQLPTLGGDPISPRLSQLYNSSRVIIGSNSDPNGVLSIEASPSAIDETPSVVQLTVYRRGGTFGTISVRVRTIGGGESWTVDEQPGPSNNTVKQVLGNRNKILAATAGVDYRQVDEVVTFQDGQLQAQLSVAILDDAEPESDETVVVYLDQVTGGARVANGASDSGRTDYTIVTIKRNDLWNGLIGFAPYSLLVTADEDGSAKADLVLERKNASRQPYEARVGWAADFTKDSKMDGQLVTSRGEVVCPAYTTLCRFSVFLRNDTIPEFKGFFTVQLNNPGDGVKINRVAQSARVDVLPSDDPNGLIQFAQESRIVHVEKNARSVQLRVRRAQGMSGQVNVTYQTVQLDNSNLFVSGVKVYPALENADYIPKSGLLIFSPDQSSSYITIPLTPVLASDNPLPKLFQVRLNSPTGGARLDIDARASNVTIVEDGETKVWDVSSMIYERLTDDTHFNNILTSLLQVVQDSSLSQHQVIVVETVLKTLIGEGERRKLSSNAIKKFLDIFCALLSSVRTDATRGRFQLRPIYESFVFITLKDKVCESTLEQYSECASTRFSTGRLKPDTINGYEYKAERQDYITVPSKFYLRTGANEQCKDIAFMEYNSEQWFSKTGDTLLGNKVLSVEIKNTESQFIEEAVKFRISTPDGSIATRRARCAYYDDASNTWRTNTDVCQVTNNLDLGLDTFVECSCKHMSSYAVLYTAKDPNIVGYPVWFHVSCFICMAGLVLAILSHHICSMYTMFSAGLLMHMCFAALATQICYVIAAYISPEYLLVKSTTEDNYRCIVMGVFMHYFFLAQFTWMLTQAINFFKILVMNDEHTDRKYVLFFLLGWGLPAVVVGLFYAVTYVVYRQFGLPDNFIYGDVNNNRDICFITNGYSALAGLVGPALICLFVVAICFTKAFQVTPQWQAYDDVYRGRYNIKEVKTILFFWAIIILTWIFGGLHMAIGHLWMLIFFVIFNIVQGLYAFIVYTALRNPCLPCFRPQKASYTLDINESGSPPIMYVNPTGSMNGSIKGSRASLANESWEHDSIGNGIPGSQMRVKRSPAPANVYITNPMHSPDENDHGGESQDFDDLIFALKTGGSFAPEDSGLDPLQDDEQPSASDDQAYGLRRISIADTHL